MFFSAGESKQRYFKCLSWIEEATSWREIERTDHGREGQRNVNVNVNSRFV